MFCRQSSLGFVGTRPTVDRSLNGHLVCLVSCVALPCSPYTPEPWFIERCSVIGLAGQSQSVLGSQAAWRFENVPSILTIHDSVFDSNVATGRGGAVTVVTGLSVFTISRVVFRRCRFTNNGAFAGGAVSIVSSAATFHSCTWMGNRATRSGGTDTTAHGIHDDIAQEVESEHVLISMSRRCSFVHLCAFACVSMQLHFSHKAPL
jgi:hypothetical protein